MAGGKNVILEEVSSDGGAVVEGRYLLEGRRR